VQIDLGETKKIDRVKLLPRVNPRGYVSSVGFPARFKIEISDDKDFTTSIMYENRLREDFKDPYDEVITFNGKEAYGRYVRLTAIHLRQQRLAFTKIAILSADKLFQGVDGIDFDIGITTPNVQEAKISRIMMKAAGQNILLADSSKIGRRSLGVINKIEAVDMLITDSGIDREDVKRLEDMGIKVIVV
jgi:hypothetical protein